MPRRMQHFAAMVLIGDGLLAVFRPSRDASAWKLGPEPWRSLMGFMAERPGLTRTVGVAQILLGLWWATRQDPKEQG
jgi:hypothetical protein